MNVERIKLTAIRTDGGTQIRAELDSSKVESYGEKYEAGVELPTPVVFYDGSVYWLADGFHRVAAHRAINHDSIRVEVRAGTRRDAILFAVGANEEHGLPRTNADKRRAVETLLRDEEWSKWGDREIARRCKVHHTMVGRVRSELSLVQNTSDPRRFVTKHGTEAVMNTAAIGRTKPVAPSEGASTPLSSAMSGAPPIVRLPAAAPAVLDARNLFTPTAATAPSNDEAADAYDPGEDEDDADAVVAEVDDEPVRPAPAPGPRRWGDFELSSAVAELVGRCRDFRAELERIFGAIEPARRDDFAERAEPALLELFEALRERLPVTARRAEDNRARMRVLDGGK